MNRALGKGASAFAILFAVSTTACLATPITYFFSGSGSGTIGGKVFSNAPYVIALSGDTSAIDTTWAGLAEWRNAVTGTIQVKRLGTATITEPLLITTVCGAGDGGIGIERPPGSVPFAAYIFSTTGVPDVDCVLGPANLTTGLVAGVRNFVNVQSTKGPITLTSSSSLAYQAQSCSASKARACRKQSVKSGRVLLKTHSD
jgi:hypothetical protein